jgi:hypothetical protein
MVDAIGLLIISSSSVKSRFLTNVQQIKREQYLSNRKCYSREFRTIGSYST